MKKFVNKMGDYDGQVVDVTENTVIIKTNITEDSYTHEEVNQVNASEYIQLVNELKKYKDFYKSVMKGIESLDYEE